MGFKIINESGTYMDCTPMHGKWCNIDLVGQDTGYAQVGIISSGKDYIYFQYRDKRGIVPKMYVRQLVEVRMNARRLKKQSDLIVVEWDPEVDPFTLFLGKDCNIHMHQTRMFEASPGFFRANIMYVGDSIIQFRENSKVFTIRKSSICGLMEC